MKINSSDRVGSIFLETFLSLLVLRPTLHTFIPLYYSYNVATKHLYSSQDISIISDKDVEKEQSEFSILCQTGGSKYALPTT